MKPLVVMDRNGDLAMATEEQAVRRVFEDEGDVINYDGLNDRFVECGNRGLPHE